MPYTYFSSSSLVKSISVFDGVEQSENPFAPNYKHKKKDAYSSEFYKIRPEVIKRFSDRCFVCGELGFEIHHIDYSKNNNDKRNLVLLCKSCHSKTNSNRGYWKNYFQEKLNIIGE
jgi:5-methylcytosine-specific restriction endonuclease McrA